MAWGTFTALGTAASKVTATSTTWTLTNAVSIGEVIFVGVAIDNVQTTDGPSTTVTSVTDSVGNTYTKVYEYTNGNGAAAAGVAAALFMANATVAMTTSSTFTVLHASVASRATTAFKGTIGAGHVAVPVAGPSSVFPATGTYLGAYAAQNFNSGETQSTITSRETLLGRKLDIDHHFYGLNAPTDGMAEFDIANGRIPLLTLSGDNSWASNGGYTTALAGGWDTDFVAWANYIKGLGSYVFLRPWQEMNGHFMPWSLNDAGTTPAPASYVQLWLRLHGIFQAQGATNAIFVWCANMTNFNIGTNTWRDYYPGDAYVDAVGVDGYNKATSARSFAKILHADGTSGGVYDDFAPSSGSRWSGTAGKPIMVCEYGVPQNTAYPGGKPQWYIDERAYIKASAPDLKAIVYEDSYSDTQDDNRINTTATLDTANQTLHPNSYILGSGPTLTAYLAMSGDAYFNQTVITTPSGVGGVGIGSAVDATTSGPTTTFGGLSNTPHIWIAVDALESQGTDTYTSDANFISVMSRGTSGGTVNTNVTVNMSQQQATATTVTHHSTNSAAADWSSILVVFDEITQAAPPSAIATASGLTPVVVLSLTRAAPAPTATASSLTPIFVVAMLAPVAAATASAPTPTFVSTGIDSTVSAPVAAAVATGLLTTLFPIDVPGFVDPTLPHGLPDPLGEQPNPAFVPLTVLFQTMLAPVSAATGSVPTVITNLGSQTILPDPATAVSARVAIPLSGTITLFPPAAIAMASSGMNRKNTFEIGADGVAITTTNSGGLADAGFTTTQGTTGLLGAFSTAQAMHGSVSAMWNYTSSSSVELYWENLAISGPMSATMFIRLASAPSTSASHVRFYDTASPSTFVICRLQVTGAKKLQFLDSTSTAIAASLGTTVLSLSTWYRIELEILNAGATALTAKWTLFSGDSTSPLETNTVTGQAGTANGGIGTARLGTISGVTTYQYWLDDPQVYVRPVVLVGMAAPLPTATASVPTVIPSMTMLTPVAAATASVPAPTVVAGLVAGPIQGTATASVPLPSQITSATVVAPLPTATVAVPTVIVVMAILPDAAGAAAIAQASLQAVTLLDIPLITATGLVPLVAVVGDSGEVPVPASASVSVPLVGVFTDTLSPIGAADASVPLPQIKMVVLAPIASVAAAGVPQPDIGNIQLVPSATALANLVPTVVWELAFRPAPASATASSLTSNAFILIVPKAAAAASAIAPLIRETILPSAATASAHVTVPIVGTFNQILVAATASASVPTPTFIASSGSSVAIASATAGAGAKLPAQKLYHGWAAQPIVAEPTVLGASVTQISATMSFRWTASPPVPATYLSIDSAHRYNNQVWEYQNGWVPRQFTFTSNRDTTQVFPYLGNDTITVSVVEHPSHDSRRHFAVSMSEQTPVISSVPLIAGEMHRFDLIADCSTGEWVVRWKVDLIEQPEVFSNRSQYYARAVSPSNWRRITLVPDASPEINTFEVLGYEYDLAGTYPIP